MISLIFFHRAVLWVKRIILVNGSQLTRSDCTVQSRFQNHVYRLFKNFFNVDNVLAWRFKGFDSKSFCFCVFFFFFFWVCLLAKNPITNIHGFKSDNFVGVPWWEGLDFAMAEVRLIGSLSMEEERLQIYIEKITQWVFYFQ